MRSDPDSLFFTAAGPGPVPPWEHHVHTHYSDGTASILQIIEKAQRLGLERVIFTEHTEPGLTAGPGWFDRYVAELKRLRLGYELDIRIGLEVPIIDFNGGLQLEPEMEQALAGDADIFLLGAVHAYPGHGWNVGTLEPERAIDMEFNGLMSMMNHPRINAIAHPGGVCDLYATPFPLDRFEAVVAKATDNGIAIELNPAYQKPMAPYLEICRRHNAWISPGSNAHHAHEVGRAWTVLSHLWPG